MNPIKKMSDDPRVLVRRAGTPDTDRSCVVYWMQRAQRAFDNPALDTAVSLGNELRKPIVVFFAPVPFYPGANVRHFHFLASGIADIADGLTRRGIGFVFRAYPERSLLKFCEQVRPAIVVGDENPLRETEAWRQKVAGALSVPFWTVDADVVVPSRLFGREHYAARTIRPRLLELLPRFLKQSDNPIARVPFSAQPELPSADWQEDFTRGWTLDRSAPSVNGWRGGNQEALRRLDDFVREKLAIYPDGRNRPESDNTSRLSPYLYFGHIGPQTIALRVQQADLPEIARQAFLDQLIVRRELAVNFVRFNPVYDSIECLEPWGRSFACAAFDGPPSDRVLKRADRKRRNARAPVERGAKADGADRLDAQLPAHVHRLQRMPLLRAFGFQQRFVADELREGYCPNSGIVNLPIHWYARFR